MTTRVITLWRENVTSLTTSVSKMCFLIEILFVLKVIKSCFKGQYDKQNLTLVVISFDIYETRRNDHSCKILSIENEYHGASIL